MFQEKIRAGFNFRGTRSMPKRAPLLVCLTSIESRLPYLHITLASLMNQNVKPDRILLYLHESIKNIPAAVLAMQRRGLEIIQVKGKDTRSYRKIIPALKDYPDAVIATADDDLLYSPRWLSSLYRAYRKEPHYVHCHRAHRITLNNQGQALPYLQWKLESPRYQGPAGDLLPTHGAGALLSKKLLHEDVIDDKKFLSLAPYADDIWLYFMARMKGTKIKKISPYSSPLLDVVTPSGQGVSQLDALLEKNVRKGGNDVQFNAVCEHYNLLDRVS